jgi:hypothetical protein
MTVRLVGQETGRAVPVKDLFAVEQNGLRVLLQKGRERSVKFGDKDGRVATVTYNRQFRGDLFLIPQQPDMLITIHRPAWPEIQLVLDAKYRIDASPEYVAQFGTPGPPVDAINSLHRYRDAILEQASPPNATTLPKRMVLQAAAAFPYRDRTPMGFEEGRLWRSLQRLGVGAVPALPDSTEYLASWLRNALRQGGWDLSDRAISSSVLDAAAKWRIAAAEPVLVGVLRNGNEADHLGWIQATQTYYARLMKQQNRQFAVKRVAIYSPSALRDPGAITHVATVVGIEVLERGDIVTPWQSRRNQQELQVVYRLGRVLPLQVPILNAQASGGATVRFSVSRWTSVLALERATILSELFLETEEEWRLYEDLKASGINFQIRSSPAMLVDPENPAGRAWFVAADVRARYQGADGFVFRLPAGGQLRVANARRAAEVFIRGEGIDLP